MQFLDHESKTRKQKKRGIALHANFWGEVALEAQALRQRMMEDRLAAEAQAAENHEALVQTSTFPRSSMIWLGLPCCE